MTQREVKKSALLFGEGKRELIFFNFLLKSNKFKSLGAGWSINSDHASGSSCEVVLDKCILAKYERSYDIILCFIDTDKLFHDYPKTHQKKKKELEAKALKEGIKIIWQDKNHEDVLRKASNGKIVDKSNMKGKLKRYEQSIFSSDFFKTIHSYFA